jgi:hypothetical protein
MTLLAANAKCATILLTYRRPRHTAAVLEALRRDQVQNLFFFSDGPAKPEHQAEVEETRALAKTITWTKPILHFRDQNLGLAKSVVDAIQIAFEQFDEIIVLEDDCVPAERFFEFTHQCLSLYRNNREVFGISGYAPDLPEHDRNAYPYDVFFLPRASSWGWATWKDRWNLRIADLRTVVQECLDNHIRIGTGGEDVPLYVQSALTGQLHDTWTIPWVLTVNWHRAVFAYPIRAQIDNIGFDGSGIHCSSSHSLSIAQSIGTKPLRIPTFPFIHAAFYREFCRQFQPSQPIRDDQIQATLRQGSFHV